MGEGSTCGAQPATEPPDVSGTPGLDPSALRRRAAALAGHQGDTASASALLEDPDPAVRGTALGALARLGTLDETLLARGFHDPDRSVRRRACELARTHRTGETRVALEAALHDPDPFVAEAAASALGEHGRSATQGVESLMMMAREHKDPLCREAAVAALGAIGDPRGLPSVLASLADKPAIRRRAAVALAGFDDPAATAGLEQCLTDRDWQVRQAAEELLRTD